jgi:hypothetical protein
MIVERIATTMKIQKPLLIVLVLAVTGMFLMSRYVFAKSSPADDAKRKWEYCHLYAPLTRDEGNHYKAAFQTEASPQGKWDYVDSDYTGLGALNRLGADGWEVVLIIPVANGPSEYLLKRPRS